MLRLSYLCHVFFPLGNSGVDGKAGCLGCDRVAAYGTFFTIRLSQLVFYNSSFTTRLLQFVFYNSSGVSSITSPLRDTTKVVPKRRARSTSRFCANRMPWSIRLCISITSRSFMVLDCVGILVKESCIFLTVVHVDACVLPSAGNAFRGA